MRVSVTGSKELRRALKKLDPGENFDILRKSLIKAADLIQEDAADVQILKGGGGKRSGMTPPDPKHLTARIGNLRRSIGPDLRPLPFAIEVGTELFYGKIHELGLGRYPERPFLSPAIEKVAPKFEDIFLKNWKREAGV